MDDYQRYRRYNQKPIVTRAKPSHRLKSAPANWRPLSDGELKVLARQPENIRTKLSKHCSLNNKIHKCLKFDGTVYTYRTELSFEEIAKYD